SATAAELEQLSILQIGHATYPKARRGLGEHIHVNAYEICYLRKGRMHWWLDNPERQYVVEAGDFTVCPPNTPHGGVDNIHEACDLYWLNLDFDSFRRETDLGEAVYKQLEQQLMAAPPSFSGDRRAVDCFEQILQAIENPGSLKLMRIRSALSQLLISLSDALRKQAMGEKEKDPRIQRVLNHIAEDVCFFDSVDQMADFACISPNRFITTFRKVTGYSPIDFLCREKVRHGKDMLLDVRRPITDIALSLNFSSTQYFATLFKKHTGMSPTQYRKESLM
ncbi:MAG: AraC family transcriptional regulator, partial [Lentisphaeria bacterium]|nr:AraC family transcriptional regulator [Lentisphaeria bacterium]